MAPQGTIGTKTPKTDRRIRPAYRCTVSTGPAAMHVNKVSIGLDWICRPTQGCYLLTVVGSHVRDWGWGTLCNGLSKRWPAVRPGKTCGTMFPCGAATMLNRFGRASWAAASLFVCESCRFCRPKTILSGKTIGARRGTSPRRSNTCPEDAVPFSVPASPDEECRCYHCCLSGCCPDYSGSVCPIQRQRGS